MLYDGLGGEHFIVGCSTFVEIYGFLMPSCRADRDMKSELSEPPTTAGGLIGGIFKDGGLALRPKTVSLSSQRS